MARPPSEGLTYFSLDVDMDQDDKVAFIESKYGLIGFGVIIRLLMKIYRSGYYITWSEREQYLFTKGISVDIALTKTIVNECINEGIFDINLFEKYGILTSHGIQMRYLKGSERRKRVLIIQEYFLIDRGKDDVKLDNVTLTSINVSNNPDSGVVNANGMSTLIPQSKVKESKVKKSKEYNPPISPLEDEKGNSENDLTDNLSPREGNPSSEADGRVDGADGAPHGELSAPDRDPQFMAFWNAYPKKAGKLEGYQAWKALLASGVKASNLIIAAGKYAFFCKANKVESQFIKYLPNFLEQGTYLDHMPINKQECPHCRGVGWVDAEEDDGYGGKKMVMVPCKCRAVG